MSDIRYCERCGAPLIPGSRSCDNCGMQQSSRQQQTDIRPPYHPGHSIPRVNRGQGQNQNYSQQQPVSQPGPGRKPHPTEPRDSGRRQRAQQSMPDRRQYIQQPMPNRSQPQPVPQPGQRQNPRPYRVDDGWEQSWERMGADEDERRFTPAQCVLIGIIVVSLAALLAFGIFWVGLRSSDRSARDRIGVQPPAVNQNAQPADASPTGGTSADQKTPSEESPDQDTQPDDGTADIIILN